MNEYPYVCSLFYGIVNPLWVILNCSLLVDGVIVYFAKLPDLFPELLAHNLIIKLKKTAKANKRFFYFNFSI